MMKYLILLLPLIIVGCGILVGSQANQPTSLRNETVPQLRVEVELSPEARACLEHPSVKGAARPHEGIKPTYLSGDFDGDGSNDVAVMIKGPKTGRNGVLICTARQTIL